MQPAASGSPSKKFGETVGQTKEGRVVLEPRGKGRRHRDDAQQQNGRGSVKDDCSPARVLSLIMILVPIRRPRVSVIQGPTVLS